MPIDINKLYQRWVRESGEEKVTLKYPSLRGLYSWFLRQSKDSGIDPETIDFEAIVDPTLHYDENQGLFKSYFPQIPTPEQPLKTTKEELEKALLMYENEANEIKKELGLPTTDLARIEELEGKVIESETKLSRTKEQLKKTREELTRLESEIARAKVKPLEKLPIKKPMIVGEEPPLTLTEHSIEDLKTQFHHALEKAHIFNPQQYDSEFNATIDVNKDFQANSVATSINLVKNIIKLREKELPTTEIQDLKKEVKRLDDKINSLQVGGGVAGVRKPHIVEVEDWYSHDMIEIDEDEVFRLKILLYDWACTISPKYLVISPESQIKTYGRTTRGMIKTALEDGDISIAQIRQVGLDPKAYGITEPEE